MHSMHVVLQGRSDDDQDEGGIYLNYVEQWLDTLPAGESEDFREFADVLPPSLRFGYMQGWIPRHVY